MKLRIHGPNQTEVETPTHLVFFSYDIPVACFDKTTGEYYRTTTKHSLTTEKHINKWIGMNNSSMPQAFFDNL